MDTRAAAMGRSRASPIERLQPTAGFFIRLHRGRYFLGRTMRGRWPGTDSLGQPTTNSSSSLSLSGTNLSSITRIKDRLNAYWMDRMSCPPDSIRSTFCPCKTLGFLAPLISVLGNRTELGRLRKPRPFFHQEIHQCPGLAGHLRA